MSFRLRPLALLALASTLGGAGLASAKPALNAAGLWRLAHYEVLAFTDPGGNGFDKGKAIGTFDATPDEVFRVVTDYDRSYEYAPRVVESRVVERYGDASALVWLKSNLPWPVSQAWTYAHFQAERLGGDTYRVKFWQVKGTMKRYFGSILIEPWQSIDRKHGPMAVVTYEALAEPDTSAPKRVVNGKVAEGVTQYIHALRQHVNDMHRLGMLHPQRPPDPNFRSPLAGAREAAHAQDVAHAP